MGISGLLSGGNSEAWIWYRGDRYFKMTLNVKNNGAISDKVNEVSINDDKGDNMESETKANMQNVIKEFGADIKSIKLSPKVENGITKPGERPTDEKPTTNVLTPADPKGVIKLSPKVDNGISKPGDKPTEDKPKSNIVNPADPIGVTKINPPPRKNRENENSKPSDKSKDTSTPSKSGIVNNKGLENGILVDKLMLSLEDANKKIVEVGDFSLVLQDVLLFLLQKSLKLEDNLLKESETRKTETEKNNKELQQMLQDENTKLKQIIKKENEERQRDMKEIEGFVKKENAERKKETVEVFEKIKSDEDKRQKESKSLEDKIAREKRELEEYLKKESLEHAQKMELENKAVKEIFYKTKWKGKKLSWLKRWKKQNRIGRMKQL